MNLLDQLIYLDREFISAKYEAVTGHSAETRITKSEGINASARVPIFSAGASSIESKSYTVSTVEMLSKLMSELKEYSEFTKLEFGKPSIIGWVNGTLTLETVKVKRSTSTITVIGKPDKKKMTGKPPGYNEEQIAEETYYSIHTKSKNFALIPTPDYFVSGVASFRELASTVVGPIEIPVRALVRVFSVQTSFKQWVAVPMVILENYC